MTATISTKLFPNYVGRGFWLGLDLGDTMSSFSIEVAALVQFFSGYVLVVYGLESNWWFIEILLYIVK